MPPIPEKKYVNVLGELNKPANQRMLRRQWERFNAGRDKLPRAIQSPEGPYVPKIIACLLSNDAASVAKFKNLRTTYTTMQSDIALFRAFVIDKFLTGFLEKAKGLSEAELRLLLPPPPPSPGTDFDEENDDENEPAVRREIMEMSKERMRELGWTDHNGIRFGDTPEKMFVNSGYFFKDPDGRGWSVVRVRRNMLDLMRDEL